MIQISKNCYRGKAIKNPQELMELALSKKSVCIKHGLAPSYFIRPASFMINWSVCQIMRIIRNEALFYVTKK